MSMQRITSKTAAATAALALFAAPGLAQGGTPPGHETSPAKLCENESKKKTFHGQGKSPFAACVSGTAKQRAEARREPNPSLQRSASRLCRNESRKKDANDTKSPFAACVKGVTVQRKAQREAAQS
jgi:hypothetical protein